MEKITYWFKGCWNCFSWIIAEIFKDCVDLKFWKIPLHPNDLLWYAERVNGRIAMLAILFVLQVELITHKSIWEFVNVL